MVEEHAASIQFIQTFLKSSVKEEAQKIQFLQTISTLSKAARDEGFSQELKEFYHRFQVAKNIEALVEEEPMDHLHTAVRQEAMLALAHMSNVEMALGDKKKSLLEACFRSVFLLPPKTDMQDLDNFLYFDTLDAMDIMLKSLVLSSPGCGDLRIILQMLLPFTDIKNAAACERAVVRIGKLADLMDSSFSEQVWSLLADYKGSSHNKAIHDRLLGQLLGHLIVCWTSKIWEIQREALDTLHYLCRFIQQQKCVTSPEDNLKHPQREGKRKAGEPSWLSLCSTRSIVKAFGEYLHPPDRTVILLKAIEALRDSCICDKEELISIVDVAMTEPASWLTEVPIVVSCIYNNLEHISAASSVWHTLDMLLLTMAELCPVDTILRLVHLSPACDSVAMAMWEVLLSQRLILENILRELSIRFDYLSVRWKFRSHRVEACIQLLALLASSDVTPNMFAGVYRIQKLLMPQRLFSLVLQGLVMLSQSPDSARKILVMLPDLMKTLQSAHNDDKIRALLIFRNVMGHLKKKASSVALELAENLRQLFDDECSQIQELSICLFKDVIQMADCKDKRQMQKNVRRSLVPLVLHMSDEIKSVAKASQEALWAAVKVLRWKWHSHRVHTLETWRTVECLLEQEQSRAEEYVCQSLLYLQHAQVSVRLAAVRFIGLAARCLKDNNPDMLLEVCEALHHLGREVEPQVSSLAFQTIHILTCLHVRPRQGRILRALCCSL